MIDFNSHTTEGGTLVISLKGQLEQSNDYFFKCVLDEIEAGNTSIVINFAEMGYISSVGLGALVRVRSRIAAAGGTIFLARIENNVLDVFRLVRFDKVFNIYGTEAEAIAAIEAK